VTVVVATRDRPDSLSETIAALRHAIEPGDEVVIADSASADARTRDVAQAAGVRYVRSEVPGASVARNLGASLASGEVIAFTDDDCRPRPGWSRALAAAYVDPEVAFVTGPVVGADGGTAADTVDLGRVVWRWPADPGLMGSGASMSVRRAAFEAVGGFDERIGPGARFQAPEEHELVLRLLRAGWAAAFASGAIVDHHDHRDRWTTLRLFFLYGVRAGALCAMCRSLDPAHARRLLWDRLWRRGVRLAAEDLRHGRKEASARAVVMAAGVVLGRVSGRRLRSRPVPHRGLPPI